MEWVDDAEPGGEVAEGEFYAYLVVVESARHGVVLTRFRKGHLGNPGVPFPLAVAGDAARNAVFFPLGRGPGRPGGEPELEALVATAQLYAEHFEAGESLEGYPAWQQPRVILSSDTGESRIDLPRAAGVDYLALLDKPEPAMVFLPGRKRFACERCSASVFTRRGEIFTCNGCGAQYKGIQEADDDDRANC
jgi:hypothetical protein